MAFNSRRPWGRFGFNPMPWAGTGGDRFAWRAIAAQFGGFEPSSISKPLAGVPTPAIGGPEVDNLLGEPAQGLGLEIELEADPRKRHQRRIV